MNLTENKHVYSSILSLTRLKQAFKSDLKLQNEIWLAGKVLIQNNHYYLTSALITAVIPKVNASSGQMVKLKLQRSDILYSNEQIIIEKVQHCQWIADSCQTKKFLNPEFDEQLYAEWPLFLTQVRDFFSQNGCVEVNTPTLVDSPGPEPTLEVFSTKFKMGQFEKTVYLPTSPEIQLKKLLAYGFTDVFEISPSFRNGEITAIHQPEFHMLEWYRSFFSLENLLDEVKIFLKQMHHQQSARFKWVEPEIYQVKDLFKKYCAENLLPQATSSDMLLLIKKLQLDYSDTDSFNDLFFRIFLQIIEPELAKIEAPVIVYNYPKSLAALAKVNKEGWANRFEVYWRGVELANAFDELTDPIEQQKRLILDNLEKLKLGLPVVPIDNDFLTGLNAGLPPTAGIAVGLERLFCILNEVDDIEKINPMSWSWKLKRNS